MQSQEVSLGEGFIVAIINLEARAHREKFFASRNLTFGPHYEGCHTQ